MTKPFKLVLLNLCCCLLLACNKPSANNNPSPPERPTPVTAITVEHKALNASTILIGTLTTPHQTQVFNQEEGQIIKLPYREGDWVEKGAELVRLDPEIIRAELIKATAQLRQAEVDLIRMEKLLARKAASEDEVARSRTALGLARAELDLQHILMARTTIKAPFAGVISERWKKAGDVVAAHTHILTLIDPSVLSVELHVSELLLPELQANDPVKISIDALGKQSFTGQIKRIYPVIDPQTRQGRVEVELHPVPRGARPGQLARITFTTQKTIGLIVPFASLQHDSQGAFVYRIDDQGTARRVSVSTGLQVGDKIEILEGLLKGDRVVLSGLINVQDGQAVRIVSKQAL